MSGTNVVGERVLREAPGRLRWSATHHLAASGPVAGQKNRIEPGPANSPWELELWIVGVEPAPELWIVGVEPAPELWVVGVEPVPELWVVGVEPAPELWVVGVEPAPGLWVVGVEPAPELWVVGVEPAPELWVVGAEPAPEPWVVGAEPAPEPWVVGAEPAPGPWAAVAEPGCVPLAVLAESGCVRSACLRRLAASVGVRCGSASRGVLNAHWGGRCFVRSEPVGLLQTCVAFHGCEEQTACLARCGFGSEHGHEDHPRMNPSGGPWAGARGCLLHPCARHGLRQVALRVVLDVLHDPDR